VWIGGLVLVVLLGIVAVLVAAGGDDEVDEDVASRQTAPVEVTTGSGTTVEAPADALLPTFEEGAADEAVGRTIPTVTGRTFDGEELTIGPDGTAKVIVFVAHWCPHCQREVPVIVDHLADAPMPDDVELVTVSTAVAPDRGNYPPEAWLEEEGWTAPVLADSEDGAAATAFGLKTFPYFVAVDADGEVVQRASGELPPEVFDQLVEAARTGEPPT
jgi:thiol-disulfide isomerase/thioredoxin